MIYDFIDDRRAGLGVWGWGSEGKTWLRSSDLYLAYMRKKKGSKKGRWCHDMHLLSMDSIPWKSTVAHAIYGARCSCRVNVMPFLRFSCTFVIDSDGEDQICLWVLYSLVWVPGPLSQTSHRAELDSVRKWIEKTRVPRMWLWVRLVHASIVTRTHLLIPSKVCERLVGCADVGPKWPKCKSGRQNRATSLRFKVRVVQIQHGLHKRET